MVGLNGEFVHIAQLGANHLSKSSVSIGKLRVSAPRILRADKLTVSL